MRTKGMKVNLLHSQLSPHVAQANKYGDIIVNYGTKGRKM